MSAGTLGGFPLRAEDVALAAGNLVAIPLVAVLGGGPATEGTAPLLGLVEFLAVLGAIAALATRAPESRPLEADSLHGWLFAGPLLGGVGLVGADATRHLGIDASGVLGLLTFAAVIAAFVFGHRLPVVAEPWRRLLVTPFVLVASTWFTAFVGDLFEGLDLSAVARELLGTGATPEAATIAAIVAFGVAAGSAAFYAMLIVAPRELASPEPRPRVWLLRYVVFAASAALGAGSVVLL